MTKEYSLKTARMFEEDHLVYSRELRCYTYAGVVLFKETGEKARTRPDAMEALRFELDNTDASTAEKTFGIATLIWTVPVTVLLSALETALYLPAYPYAYYKMRKARSDSFASYVQADDLLKQGKYVQARATFMKAKEYMLRVTHQSDVYFKIAEAYEGEGNGSMAADYYKKFLDYSVGLYPDYFELYDSAYANDPKALEKEFDKADAKLMASALKK